MWVAATSGTLTLVMWLDHRAYNFIVQGWAGLFVCYEDGACTLGRSPDRADGPMIIRLRGDPYLEDFHASAALLRGEYSDRVSGRYRVRVLTPVAGSWSAWMDAGGFGAARAPAWLVPFASLLFCVLAYWMSRSKPGCCSKCGYDLAGLSAAPGGAVVCPECGKGDAKGSA